MTSTEPIIPIPAGVDRDLAAAVQRVAQRSNLAQATFITGMLREYQQLVGELESAGNWFARKQLRREIAKVESLLKTYLPLARAAS